MMSLTSIIISSAAEHKRGCVVNPELARVCKSTAPLSVSLGGCSPRFKDSNYLQELDEEYENYLHSNCVSHPPSFLPPP